jgi:FlaA1/EpsC-like NDP-sugar epimerase
MWRYADIEDFFYVEIAVVSSNLLFFVVVIPLGIALGPRTHILTMLMSSFLLFIFRLAYRLNRILEARNSPRFYRKRMLIVGGGEATFFVSKEIFKSPDSDCLPVCIVDDDKIKTGRSISGVKVVGTTSEIPKICDIHKIDTILFSVSSISPSDKKRFSTFAPRPI